MSLADRTQAVALIAIATASGARKHEACEILGITVRTLERWEEVDGLHDKRCQVEHHPANKLSQEQRQRILNVANDKKYRDMPPCKIVPMLADEGHYIASESTFYRVLRAENLLAHRQLSRPSKHRRPDAYEATGPNQVWSWDISYLPTQVRGLYFYLYMILDIYSRKIVGWSVHDTESAEHAADLINQACLDENVKRDQLVLHSDNGAPMKGATMLSMLQKLGVVPSFSRPSVSDDNPYSEALFKTAKYHPMFPLIDKFATSIDAREWGEKFSAWYNHEHLHSALKFVTPHQRHEGEDEIILRKRHSVYTLAKLQSPERWSGNTRNWVLPKMVTLNPNKKINSNKQANNKEVALAA